MKKTLPLLLLMALSIPAFSQTCMRDSTLLQSGELLSPAYWDTVTMEYNLAIACVNQPYQQSVTVFVPSSFQNIPINNVTVATTGAVTGLPVGLTYTCDPPNCVFLANTLGCIRLFGTPTNANIAPDTFDLGIVTSVNTLLGPIPLTFPENLPGDNHYYLVLKDEQCLVSVSDQNRHISSVKIAPNPLNDVATISIESLVSGDFQMEVFNLLGNRVQQKTIRLDAGSNDIKFDGSALANGAYFLTLGNQDGKVARRLVIAR